jgi:hypothetical protein
MADPAAPVANDDDRRKTEAPPALHHLGHAIDPDQLFNQLRLIVTRAPVVA